ncbi:MAG TPA: hypothetical protein VNA69_04070 [Thermoanaerobaculia bacterium]|nr:hypothetical protein [Thermoanaerobaculia bacterium]
MPGQHFIDDARKRPPRLVREASRSRRFSEAWKEFTSEVTLSELAIDPDEIFNNPARTSMRRRRAVRR